MCTSKLKDIITKHKHKNNASLDTLYNIQPGNNLAYIHNPQPTLDKLLQEDHVDSHSS